MKKRKTLNEKRKLIILSILSSKKEQVDKVCNILGIDISFDEKKKGGGADYGHNPNQIDLFTK